MGLWRVRLEHYKIFKGQQSAQCEIKPGEDVCLDLHTVWNSQKAGLSSRHCPPVAGPPLLLWGQSLSFSGNNLKTDIGY